MSQLNDFNDFEDEERYYSKEQVDAYLATKKESFVHELKILAQQIKKWSDNKTAIMQDGVVQINQSASAELRKHIQKTYKKFEDIKAKILTIDKDYFREMDQGYFYCPYIPLMNASPITSSGNLSLPVQPAGTMETIYDTKTGTTQTIVHHGDGKTSIC